jgi:hypothetical protein
MNWIKKHWLWLLVGLLLLVMSGILSQLWNALFAPAPVKVVTDGTQLSPPQT